jgi:TonB-dependent starch-binding outer membrane protein SusC
MKRESLLFYPDDWKHCSRVTTFLLLFTFLTISVLAQNASTVSGKVTDDSGTGMPGVNVIIKGTSSGTTTDADGNYSITISPDNSSTILVFSFIGFSTHEEAVNGRSTIDVSLETNTETLNEVVVVGYGTQRKGDVTGSIASVGGETLKEVAASSVVNQLKGRAAGVVIVSNGATPGSGGQIRIRGNRSLSTNTNTLDQLDQPLIVVDGIPFGGNINDINPDDIATMDILKDASATAIYGSRGSGGVIIITTKRGTAGKLVVSYDAYYGTSKIMDKLRVFNGPEFAQFKLAAAAGVPPPNTGTNAYAITPSEQEALDNGISTDWQDLIYQRGYITNHNLSVSGGGDKTQYSLGVGYFKETGIIPNQDFVRYALRATIDNQIGNNIKIGLNMLNNVSYANAPGGSGVPGGLMRLTPLASPYNDDGTINMHPQAGTDNAAVSPLTLISKSDALLARTRRLRTFNSLYGEVQIVKGLKYRLNVGLDYRQEQRDNYDGIQTYTNTSTAPSQSRAAVKNSEAWTYTIENLLNYEKTFLDVHRVGFTGLFSVQKDHLQSSGTWGFGIPADYIQNYNLSLASTLSTKYTPPGGIEENPYDFYERGLISYMGRVTYSYDNRYNLTATVRRDGSSILSPGNQWFVYPAVAASWNVTNEQFMDNVSFISNLKLRGGWGKTSNQGIPPYSTLGGLNVKAYNFGQAVPGQQLGYTVTELPNTSLSWQSTSQVDVGMEFGLFNNRITGAVDVYSHQTKDILLSVLLPPSNGANSTFKNLGKTKGHGLEITLSGDVIRSKSGLKWSMDVVYFFNREEIVQLTTPSEKSNIANGWFVGEPLTVIYDVKKIGIWQTDDAAQLAEQTSPVQYPGQIRVEDLNNDKKIDASDRQIIGNFQPKWEGGLTNRVTFKNFDLTAVVYARMGMKILVPYVTSDGGFSGYTFFMQSRNNQLKVDYWTPENPTNAFPRPDASTDKPLFSSTLGYMDGSFIKCRSINLGYTLPSTFLSKYKISSLRFYVSAVNPFIIYSPFVKDGFGPDPEGNGYGGGVSSATAGYASGTSAAPGRQISVNANNPSTRQFIFGLNLKF